jgi:hypothetical protein
MPKNKKQPRKSKTDNGARHLRDTHLVGADGKLNKHWSGITSKKTELTCDPTYRDIGHCLAFFMKESLTACTEICYEEDAEGREALDTIGQFVAKIWNESLKNNLNGLGQFRAMYERLEEIPGGRDAYTAWTHYFFQTYISYLFTVSKMANGLREGWLDETSDYNAMLLVLSSLNEDTKKSVIKQLLEHGVWPSNISYSKLLRRLEDFTDVVKEGQRLRLQEQAEKDEEAAAQKEELLQKRKKLIGIEGPAIDATDEFLCDSGGVVVTREVLAAAVAASIRENVRYLPTRIHVCHFIVMAMEAWISTAEGTGKVGETFNTAATEKIFGIEWVLHNESELEKEVFCLVEYEEKTDDN